MLATVAEIITSVRYLVNEATASFWADAEITIYINEAQEIISTETKCLSKYYSHTLISADIVNDREVRMGSDFVAIDEGGILYNDIPLIQTSLKELDEHVGSWRDTTGTPTRFYFRSDMIGFYPKPSAGDVVKYYGIERATELSGSTVPLSSDYRTVSFRRYMRDYAVAMCFYKKNEYDKATMWMNRFEKGLYNINAILNSHKNQGAHMIPAYVPKRNSYSIRYGRTDVFD
jgi:hypothetical protein